ncbi:SCP-like protein [Necator americanus]|uniref:SCP-like protein n=1 Tax=Necator americanus TaxID=51031 RepID=W2TDV2_NECAM|nr:SCP-like protein [Necator americanus]ETN79361.1 SCP-like protein [Necator americanus]
MFHLLLLFVPGIIAYNVPFLNSAKVSHSGRCSTVFSVVGPTSSAETTPEENNGIQREKRAYFLRQFPYYSNNLLVTPDPPNDFMRKWITYEHNRYRRMVPASDMNMLYWSDELAASAQQHANTCDFRHSRGRVNVGENIWAAPYSNYSDAISIWFNEVHNPRCGCNHAYKHCCGHYVQVVWAKTNLVGCGFARCRDVQGLFGRGHRNVFVCHYNPQGNTVFVTGSGQLYAVPAFTWASGNKGRCSDCPASAPACFQGLCYMPNEQEQYSSTTNNVTDIVA